MKTEEEIADEIVKGLTRKDVDVIMSVHAADDMIQFHHSTGMWVRNHYGLWKKSWEPEIKNGVDWSPQHPDAISARILELVWTKVHQKT